MIDRNSIKNFALNFVCKKIITIGLPLIGWFLYSPIPIVQAENIAEIVLFAIGYISFLERIAHWIYENRHRKKDMIFLIDFLADAIVRRLLCEHMLEFLWLIVSSVLLALIGCVGLPVDMAGWILIIANIAPVWS